MIENTKPSDRDCSWCGARKDKDIHSAACPNGERYRQIQEMGGVKQ